MRTARFVLAACLLTAPGIAQETRGTICGRVLDPQSASIAGARVTITNTDANTSVSLGSNETGYFEAGLLLPGNYQVTAESAGFRTSIRRGLVLPMSGRLEINMGLELGAVADSVTVVAEAPLLDTAATSSGRVLDNRTQTGLPVSASNVTVFARLAPGIQSNGEVRWLGPADQGSSSDYKTSGAVGGNEWFVDGQPNTGARTVGHLPHGDTVAEVKVETSGFDASLGHSSGVQIAVMTKAGTNQYHGSLSDLHWQDRWLAMHFFSRQLYYRNIAAAEASGDSAQADRLRATPKQPSGRLNQYTGTLGGPVVIPHVFNGKDKLFFFFGFTGYRVDSTRALWEVGDLNRTLPTMANRAGDFSQLLMVDAVRYQIYDPLSVRPDPARPGNYIRTPIPGNILPSSRILNPAYQTYLKFMPPPNRDPFDPRQEPLNNLYIGGVPNINEYEGVSNRIDYNHSSHHRFFGRWNRDHHYLNGGDWSYQTAYPGLMTGGGTRHNIGGLVDWVYTPRPTTMVDFSFALHEYRTGDVKTTPMQFKPSDVGLPKYMDDKAGEKHMLPYMAPSGYTAIGWSGVPTFTRHRTAQTKIEISHIRGRHSWRAGVNFRQNFRTGGGGGNTSGNFSFSNSYTRRNDDSLTPAGNLGHSWAALMMGIPSGMTIAANDDHAIASPYYGWFVQDNWRLSPKLNITLGLRVEYELGFNERYNRMIGYFDTGMKLPISDAAEAAYAKAPIPERPASGFQVRGGTVYPGVDGVSRRVIQNELMWLPRLAAAYQLDSRTVIRAGFGTFFDSLNARVFGPNQLGFSRTTSTNLTDDFGVNWKVGDPRKGISPMLDPFPVRSDGTRYDAPVRTGLGSMAVAGGSFSFNAFDTRRSRQQRWRVGVQRQIGASIVLGAAYAGSYADRAYVSTPLSTVPEQYWADGLVRNNTIANNLNANVPNPFRLDNFAALRQSLPVVYQDMSTSGFYTSSTIRKSQLLRTYPQMTGLTQANAPFGEVRTDSLEVSFEKRFSKGFNFYAGYTRLRDNEADIYLNEFDAAPSWRESSDGRPHRLVLTGLWELPFGKGRPFAQRGPLGMIIGGWQLGVTYEGQPGPLIDFGNLFYYGKLEDINTGSRSFQRWFNTDNFERNSSRAPAAFHRRVFPTRIDGLRADFTNIWNGNIQRELNLSERFRLQLRLDVLNLANRSHFAAPDTNPLSTLFGQVTASTLTNKRMIQVQARLRF